MGGNMSCISDETNFQAEMMFQKYASSDFVKNVDHQEVSQILSQIRVKNRDNVIIGHLNVNSLVPKLDAIKTIIIGNIDIMIFGETKLDDSYPTAQLLIDGFRRPFRLDRDSNGGGLVICVRADIPSTLKTGHTFPDGIEGMFVEINLRKSKWLLLGAYHPPSQNDKQFFNAIGRALEVYSKKYDRFILAGDFNAEIQKTIFKQFLEMYNLKSLVKEKTCFKSIKNPSCIDLLLTNCHRSFQFTQAISSGCSDFHKMVFTVLKTTFKKAKPKEILYRSYKNLDNDVFRVTLSDGLRNCNDHSVFEKRILDALNEQAPLKKRIIRANEVPYMTKSLRKAIANRSRLENRYYTLKTKECKSAYKKQRNYCSRLYKKERKSFYENLDIKNILDNRLFWKTMKPFFSDKGGDKNGIKLVENDELISEDCEVAETFNNFFSSAVTSLNIDIPGEFVRDARGCDDPIEAIIQKYSNHPSIISINENVKKNNFKFKETDLLTVEEELRSLNTNKACRSGSVPTKILKEYSDICSKPLLTIINDGILSGKFDDTLKLADLVPIHKEGDTMHKQNYRNVSLLPVVSKVFEKVMQKQIGAHMDSFLSDFLCGYRKGYNSQYALLAMLEKWKKSYDKGGFGGAVLMDLSKAFDTINHDLLIAKLHAYGFDKSALKLIKSYLSNRWQRTKINTSFSSWMELILGVPQGSILGPLLFNIFINDLFFIILESDICNFADDNTLHVSAIRLDVLMNKLERAVMTALDWFEYNGMKPNARKCHLIVCGHKFESMIAKIGEENIVETHLVKLLGIFIDSKLTFDNHMDKICKTASTKLNALARQCAILPFNRRKC